MGSSRFWLKAAYEESKSIPHELPRSHWLKATGQCVLERYLSATMWYRWLTNGTNCTIGRANGTIGITIGTNGITNGTIGKTLNDIGIPLVPLKNPERTYISVCIASSYLPHSFFLPRVVSHITRLCTYDIYTQTL